MKTKKWLALALASIMLLAPAGCSGGDEPAAKPEGGGTPAAEPAAQGGEFTAKAASDIVICYSIKGQNSWLEEQARGCREACAELGIPEPTIVYNKDQADAASQAQAIQDMISLKPDVLIVDPTSATVLTKTLKEAADSGIIIMETDTCGGLDMVTASIGLDEYQAAYEQAKLVCGQLKPGDGVVIVAGQQGDANGENRLKGQQDACKDAGIEVLASQYTDWSAEEASSAMEDLITRFSGEFKAVLTPSDDMTLGCISALKQAGILDQMVVAGYGGFQIAIDEIEKGNMFMTVGMKPYQCGYQAVQIAHDILVNNEYPAETFVNVGADMITKDNCADWDGF